MCTFLCLDVHIYKMSMNIRVHGLCVHLFIQDTHVKMHICGKPGLQRALTHATDSHGCLGPCCVVSTA